MTQNEFKNAINHLMGAGDLTFTGPLFISTNDQKVIDEGDSNKDITPIKTVLDAALAAFNASEDAKVIDEARCEGYGSIGDQLDMMYWDQVNGTTKWLDHITKVKSENPK
jgi:hypothetical protein